MRRRASVESRVESRVERRILNAECRKAKADGSRSTVQGRLAGAADRHPINFKAGLADPNRHTLAIFATCSDTFIHFHIIADHGNALHALRPAAN